MHLEPRELPQVGFDVLILGSIYRLVLERLYRRVPDGDPARLWAALPEVAQQVCDDAPDDYGFRPTPPDTGCPPFCPAATFCEQFKLRSW